MRTLFLALALAAAVPSVSAAQDAHQRVEWNRPAAPFRITGEVYYVGTAGLAAYLIADPKGHVLIDGGLPESAPLIANNIEQLGFRLSDIRYLLINHSHFDHSGGLAELKQRSGAKLVASAGDRADLEAGRSIGRPELDGFPAVKVDRVVKDGETLRLGRTVLTAHLTPGHTRGCTSWSLAAPTGTVLFACSLTVAGQKLTGDPAYPEAAADFRRSFAKLRSLRADYFLNFHPEFFDLEGKRARLSQGAADPFRDPAELHRQVERAERLFEKELAAQTGG
ncbi:subclass B3 metallo-beta-lactamase [Phenylobacterium terrae]|uniref:Subclass B3 metallo-beta-lactamase n=1 Tax=Phenylobacterium terrae TaxID=2665495 RepID=A0ABW4N4B8_9CAUL